METLLEYLRSVKETFKKDCYKYVHLVLGNESCDLDSCISAISLAYYINKQRPTFIHNEAIVIPVQNVSKDDFLLRTENILVLRNAGIPQEVLVYRDEINLSNLLSTKTVTSSLVDHHILAQKDRKLETTVRQILDHRPLDPSQNWDKTIVELRIEEVGSCATLVTDEILKSNAKCLFKKLAILLYQPIVFDTIALLPENGKAKALDLSIAKILEDRFGFQEDRKNVFDKLWRAHNDISHLSPKQLLSKDLKIVGSLPVPGLPMLVINFLKLNGAYEAIEKFADERNASVLILIGLEAGDQVKRDIAIYFREDGIELKNILLNRLKNSIQHHGYDFKFFEEQTTYSNIICMSQNNTKLSRKQIIPVLKTVLDEK